MSLSLNGWSLRHTHIDIDGRNAIFSSHLFGRKEAGGKVEEVKTPSQFDREVAKAFITDKFHIVRKAGVFNCKEAWNKWLGYSRFGSARISSKEAEAQGGRQEEPMCMHFFLGTAPGNQGKVLMQYKFREDDRYWAPYGHEGIPCFSANAPSQMEELLRHPGIRTPRAWPEKEAIRAYLVSCRKLTGSEKAEWQAFFACVPTCLEDMTEDQLFEWRLPELVQQFKDAKYSPPQATEPLGEGLGDSPRPEMPDERVLWTGFTAKDAKREAKARGENYQRQKRAQEAKRSAQAVAARQKRRKGRQKAPKAGQDSEPASTSQNDTEEGLPAGDMGLVFVGDVVVFSPDKKSREVDAKSGYKLGLNIGQVVELDFEEGQVLLWWYFSSSAAWTTKAVFVPWRDSKTHDPYQDWVPADLLLQDWWGTLMKLQLTKVSGREGYAKHTLIKDSVDLIQEALREDVDSSTDGQGD